MRKLRFYLNQRLDERMAGEFISECGGGIDFGKRIVELHPQLKAVKSIKSIKQKEEVIHHYFNDYYRYNRVSMVRKIDLVNNSWRRRESEYVAITENIFGGFRFPQGKYIAYASIIDCNPRFLESKNFQFFYKKSVDDSIYTIAHELLHFIFFDFVNKKLKKDVKRLSEDQLWNLSEIFNVVILKLPEYHGIIDQRFVVPYPSHRRYIGRFNKAYENSRNIREFIKLGIANLK